MNRNLLALGAVALAASAAIVWFWLSFESRPAGSASLPSQAASPSSSAEPRQPAAAAPVEQGEHGSVAPDASERALADTDLPSGPHEWIDGSVSLPSGMPSDELLEIWAFATQTDPSSKAAALSRAAVADGKESELVARAPVGLDGAFRCAVPSDKGALWLVLAGRYCYCTEGRKVDLAAGERSAVFEPHLGTWVSGRLLPPADATEGERDLDQVQLELQFDRLRALNSMGALQADDLRRRDTHCGEDLTFEFRGVRPGVDYRLQLRPEQLAALRTEQFAAEPGLHVTLEPRLSRGGALSGFVRDDAGKPIAGAKLEATVDPLIFNQGGFEVRDGKSAADGAYGLEAVAAGKLSLKVEADGYIERTRGVELAEGQRIDGLDIVLDRGNRIAGRVTWPDGSPVASVEVDVGFDLSQIGGMGAFNAMRGAEGEGETDADGRFEVTGLGKGPFTVKVEARDAGDPGEGASDHESIGENEARPAPREGRERVKWRARADGVKPGTIDLQLVLAPPQGVAGRVTDHDGNPLAKFSVVARGESKGMIPGLGADSVSESFEHPEGQFFLSGLSAGRWELAASAEGFAPGASVALSMPLAPDAAPLVLVLERVGSVSGTVLLPNGAPAPGADVTLKLALQDLMRAGLEERRPPRTRSDAEGRFTLTGLAAGNLSVVAQAEGWAQSEPVVVELAAAQQVTDIVLRLREGGLLTGEIYEDDGSPMAGASILVQQSTDPISQRFGNADDKGLFEFAHLTPGAWNVIHMPMNSSTGDDGGGDDDSQGDMMALLGDMKMAVAQIVEGEEAHVVLGAPPKNPVHVHGRVTVGGEGVSGLFISFIADGGKGMEQMRFTTTGARGAYSIDLNEPGGYLVTAQRTGNNGEQQSRSSFLRVPEQPDFEHDVELPMGGIAGVVRRPDGELAVGVRVSLMIEGAIPNGSLMGEHYAEISTDERGAYELMWLQAGTYTVGAGGAPFGGMFGTESGAPPRQLKSGLRVVEGEWLRGVDFKLVEPGAIHGVVRDASGGAQSEAAIFIRDAQGRLLERLSMLQSDSGGRFEIPGLEPGDYTLIARTTEQVSSQDTHAHVRKGETSEVELLVTAGTTLIVSLANEEGETIECNLDVTDEAGRQVNGMLSLAQLMSALSQGTFSSKEQRVGPLPPGKYRVVATTSDGRTVNKPVTLTGQAERRLNLKL